MVKSFCRADLKRGVHIRTHQTLLSFLTRDGGSAYDAVKSSGVDGFDRRLTPYIPTCIRFITPQS
jgi:hypothetical protein